MRKEKEKNPYQREEDPLSDKEETFTIKLFNKRGRKKRKKTLAKY